MKGTLLCDVENEEDQIRFFPAKNASRKPLVSESEPSIVIKAEAPPTETGEALGIAFRSLQPGRKKPAKPRPGR